MIVKDIKLASPRLLKQHMNSISIITCNSNYNVHWFYNKEPIPFTNVKENEKRDQIMINSSTVDYGGQYYCFGYDDLEKHWFLSRVFFVVIGNYYNNI